MGERRMMENRTKHTKNTGYGSFAMRIWLWRWLSWHVMPRKFIDTPTKLHGVMTKHVKLQCNALFVRTIHSSSGEAGDSHKNNRFVLTIYQTARHSRWSCRSLQTVNKSDLGVTTQYELTITLRTCTTAAAKYVKVAGTAQSVQPPSYRLDKCEVASSFRPF